MFHVLLRMEVHDIFGSEYGDTYVTITTNRECVFFNSCCSVAQSYSTLCNTSLPCPLNIKIYCQKSVEYQIYHMHLLWQRVEK